MKKNRSGLALSRNRWSKYALAGAAGAMLTGGTQNSVDAGITYLDVNVGLVDRTQGDGYFDVFGPFTFGAAGASFTIQQAFNETASGEGQMLVVGNGNISFAGVQAGPYFYASNLAYGQAISTRNFPIVAGQRGDMAWGPGYAGSQFLDPGVGYLGYKFDVGNGTQYGYAEIVMDGSPTNTGTFNGYGWGMPGESVFGGQRANVFIPEPASLGVLALGSLGLLAWRRKRKAI